MELKALPDSTEDRRMRIARNPFNGIERVTRFKSIRIPRWDIGIHSMELKDMTAV